MNCAEVKLKLLFSLNNFEFPGWSGAPVRAFSARSSVASYRRLLG
jgi:hypothetical protein